MGGAHHPDTSEEHTSMSGHADDTHGSSPAAWTTVVLLIISCAVGAVGFVASNLAVIIVSAVLVVVSLIVGKVMQVQGHGVRPYARRPTPTLD